MTANHTKLSHGTFEGSPVCSEASKNANKNKLERYVGRRVRLHNKAFLDITKNDKRSNEPQENCFVVASVGRGMRKLICYGANLRITVGVSEIVLI